MAKKDLVEFEGHEGVWRTVGGRHIFIRTGQSLGDAMRESGKFPSYKKNKERKAGEKYDKANEEEAELNKRENAKTREYMAQGMSLEDAVNRSDKEFQEERDEINNKRTKIVNDLKKKENIKGAKGKIKKGSIDWKKDIHDEVYDYKFDKDGRYGRVDYGDNVYDYGTFKVNGQKFAVDYTRKSVKHPEYDNTYQITSSHPYDNADYHWARAEKGDKFYSIYHKTSFQEKINVDDISSEKEIEKVAKRLLELDKKKKIEPKRAIY